MNSADKHLYSEYNPTTGRMLQASDDDAGGTLGLLGFRRQFRK